MKRYLIERHIPGVGSLTAAQYKDIAATSNAAVAKLAGTVQWVQSYVAADNSLVQQGEVTGHATIVRPSYLPAAFMLFGRFAVHM
jgi:hypothetical protein